MAGFYNYGYPYNQQPAMQYQQVQQTAPQQIQNGGFVSVRSKQEALMWPIAPGSSITFKDETAPYVYTKTMGFSQLDRPQFETYRLIKEDEPEARQNAVQQGQQTRAIDNTKTAEYALKSDLEILVTAYNKLQSEIEKLKSDMDHPLISNEEKGDDSVV